jgi:hypothetical protein
MPKNKFLFLGLIAFCILGAHSLRADNALIDKDTAGAKDWVIIKPLQCLGNPWEQDWIARHKKTEVYPALQEKQIIKDFFARNQIQILDIRVRPYENGPLCQTCDCPRGDTLFLLVNAQDAPLLQPFGFDKTVPVKK